MQQDEKIVRETILQEIHSLDKRMSLLEQSVTTLSTIISEIKAALIRVNSAT